MNAYRLYLLFIASYFLHLTSRIPVLGAIRFDLILALTIITLILFKTEDRLKDKVRTTIPTEKYLRLLIVYIIISLPLVEWPGSVIGNSARFIKAIVFFYFTCSLVDNSDKLKRLIWVFLGTQIFRVLEPLYLHITQGYWGSRAHMLHGEYMDRLSGAPHDVVNPNGLAYVTVTVIVLLHFLLGKSSTKLRIVYFAILPALLYALILTGSRTSMIALLITGLIIFYKSQRKFAFLSLSVIILLGALAVMDENLKDRYLSVVSSDTKNTATAEGRMEGVKKDLQVALARPIFGHGLGTSEEANWNVRGKSQISHNLYMELLQEMGLIGTVIFLLYMKNIFQNFINVKKTVSVQKNETEFLPRLVEAMQVLLIINLVFSLASYGLSTYQWYFYGGLAVVVYRLGSSTSVENVSVGKRISKAVTYK